MTAKLILRKKEYDIRHGSDIRAALLKLGIQPEAVLPTRNGELVSEEEIIKDGDVINSPHFPGYIQHIRVSNIERTSFSVCKN